MQRLKTIFFPGQPAKGRAKAKPWRIAVGPDEPWSMSTFEIKQGIRDVDGLDVWAMVDVMVRDYNELRTRDGQVEEIARQMHEAHVGDPQGAYRPAAAPGSGRDTQ